MASVAVVHVVACMVHGCEIVKTMKSKIRCKLQRSVYRNFLMLSVENKK